MTTKNTLFIVVTWLILAICCTSIAASMSFEGKVMATSQVPDPTSSPYADCLFTLTVLPKNVETNAQPVLLALEGFVNRTLTECAGLKLGDLIRVDEARPFEEMPDDFKSRQIVDELVDLDAELYAGVTVSRIEAFSDHFFAQGLVVGAQPTLVPATRDESASEARAKTIQLEKERSQRLLVNHESWTDWYDSLEPIREELQSKLDASEYGYLSTDRTSFTNLSTSLGFQFAAGDQRYQTMIHCLDQMTREFRKAGTDLIVVPVPMKTMVYAEMFVDHPPTDRVLQPYWCKFMSDCLARDIEVVDLLPRFQQEVMKDGVFLYHFNSIDGHPSGQGVMIAAEEIGERLQRYSFSTPSATYQLSATNYVLRGVKPLFSANFRFEASTVLDADGAYAPASDESEVLIVGDSMLTAPADSKGASLGVHVMRHVGFSVTFFKRPGSASLMGSLLGRIPDPTFFSNRKVCVFIFAGNNLFRDDVTWNFLPFTTRHLEPPDQ